MADPFWAPKTDSSETLGSINAPQDVSSEERSLKSTLDIIANPNDPNVKLAETNSRFRVAFNRVVAIANGEEQACSKEEEAIREKGPIKGFADLERFETADFLGVWGRDHGLFDRLEALLRYGYPRTRLRDHERLAEIIYESYMGNLSEKPKPTP